MSPIFTTTIASVLKQNKVCQPNHPPAQYRVGPRDILTITVWDHPELTIPAGEFRSAETAGTVVGEDGNIFYPYAGVIKAAGKTVEEIREELTQKLSVYIEQVQLDVRVTAYRSQRVYVVGEVNTPGIQLVKDIPLTVLEAINSSGGLNPEADSRNIMLTRNGKTYNINLLALYEGGDLSQNVPLENGDVLNVPDSSLTRFLCWVKVILSVPLLEVVTKLKDHASVMMDKGRMTMAEALSDGGGFNQETAMRPEFSSLEMVLANRKYFIWMPNHPMSYCWLTVSHYNPVTLFLLTVQKVFVGIKSLVKFNLL